MPAQVRTLDPGLVPILKELRLPGILAGLLVGATAAAALLWRTRSRAWRGWTLVWARTLARMWTAVGPWRVAGTWAAAFLLGTALFLPGMALVQVPLLQAVSRWQAGLLPDADPLVLSILPVLLSGLVHEPVKLAGVVAALRLSSWLDACRTSLSPGRGPVLGTLVGAGYAAMQAAWLLSVAFSTISTHRQLGLLSLAVPVWERVTAAFYHAGSAAVLAWAWTRSPAAALTILGISVGLHALLSYTQVLVGAGTIGLWLPEVLATLLAFGLVGYSLAVVRPGFSPPAAGAS
ncbi:MAG: hypothetical protein AB1446_06995 [Bacillota bacterium]